VLNEHVTVNVFFFVQHTTRGQPADFKCVLFPIDVYGLNGDDFGAFDFKVNAGEA
jgi:hypothetical protein